MTPDGGPLRPTRRRPATLAAGAGVAVAVVAGVAFLALRSAGPPPHRPGSAPTAAPTAAPPPAGWRLRVVPGRPAVLIGHGIRLAAIGPGGRLRARWRSTAPQAVTVSPQGLAVARRAGFAVVVATAEGHSGRVVVQALGIRRLHVRLPGTIDAGASVRMRVVETLTDGRTPARPPLAVRVAGWPRHHLAARGTMVTARALGPVRLTVRGPDGPAVGVPLQVVATVPTNVGTVTPGFRPGAPIAVQIDNGPTADPQSGVQAADLVYEYATEGGITRFTAVYWHPRPAAHIGPIRSARLILIQVQKMYQALAVFSGASNGTYGHLIQARTPMLTDDCCGAYFYRTSGHVAPSNLFTTLGRLRSGLARLHPVLARRPLAYRLLPPHVDHLRPGPLRTVIIDQTPANVLTYGYDPATRTWARADNGVPQIDSATGRPIAVRNLVVLTARGHATHYVEDVNGNPSLYYDLGGSGPFQAFIDGRHFGGTWQRPLVGQPMVYRCADGRPLPLATGLTWIEVVVPGTVVTATTGRAG